MRRTDQTGRQFGRLTVTRYLRSTDRGSIYLCTCECGKTREVAARDMGKVKTCRPCSDELVKAHRRSISHMGLHAARR